MEAFLPCPLCLLLGSWIKGKKRAVEPGVSGAFLESPSISDGRGPFAQLGRLLGSLRQAGAGEFELFIISLSE